MSQSITTKCTCVVNQSVCKSHYLNNVPVRCNKVDCTCDYRPGLCWSMVQQNSVPAMQSSWCENDKCIRWKPAVTCFTCVAYVTALYLSHYLLRNKGNHISIRRYRVFFYFSTLSDPKTNDK